MSVSEDVVFLAEMCERNGPVVVLAHPPGIQIPSDLPVRLFSCDVFGSPCSVDGSDSVLQRDAFCILRLTLPQQPQPQPQPLQVAAQAVLSPQTQQLPLPPETNPYVAAHHFQMCEMSGRGLVRKVCVAYLTNDHHKLFQNMQIINQQLVSIARCVCEGNIISFNADVSCILEQLRGLSHPAALDRYSSLPEYSALKDALPGLLQQYERLNSQSVYKVGSSHSPVAPQALSDDTNCSTSPSSHLNSLDITSACLTISPTSPIERLSILQRFGRPIDSFRPLLSVLTPGRQRHVNDALSMAHSVCCLPPDVLWMLTQEASFMSQGDITGESFHTSICGAPLCSLSAFMSVGLAKCAAPPSDLACSEDPELSFKVDEAVSTLLRHHVLSRQAAECSLERMQASARASVSAKLPPARFEILGLRETRQLLTEPLFKNIVFALLKGENVVIRGKQDDRVLIMSVVRALSIFIPQNVLYCGTQSDSPTPPLYVEWRDGTLDICDLGGAKLVGGPMSLEIHDRAKSFVSKVSIGDKNITAVIPRYRSEEKSGLVHAIVGKNAVTEKWTNDVFTAHVRIEIANLGRNIMHWIFQHGVSRGRQMLSTKNRQLADAVGSVLGVQADSADMPKKSSAPKETLGVPAEAESKVDRSVRGKTVLAPSRTQASFAPSAGVEVHRARTQATFAPSAVVEAPKGDRLFDLSEDDFDLVQRLAVMMLRNELPSSSAFRHVNISHRQFVEEKIQRPRK